MKLSDKQGFSLIEAIITTVVISIVGVIIVYALAAGINAYMVALDRENALAPIRIALARMEKDIREVRTLKDVTTASSTQFRFRDLDYNDVNYSYASGTLSRGANALATGITSFSLTYKDINEATIASPTVSPSATDIRYVDVQMTVTVGTKSEVMKTTICPRTFRS